MTAFVHAVTGNLGVAKKTAEDAVREATEAQVPLLRGLSLYLSGLLDHWRGEEATGLEALESSTRIGHEHELPTALLWSLWSRALALTGSGRYDDALASLREHLDLAARLGDKIFRCRTLNTFGWVYADLCNWELAIEHNLKASEESRAVGDPEIIRNAETNVGDCYLALGDLDEAQRWLERVEAESAATGSWGEEWMKWRYTQHLNASLGELWLEKGNIERAAKYADTCIQAAEATDSKRNVVKGRRLRAKVRLRQGSLEGAAEDVEAALAAAREVGNPAQLWQTLEVLGGVRSSQGREREAEASFREALFVTDSMAEGIRDGGLRTTMLRSGQVAGLRARVETPLT